MLPQSEQNSFKFAVNTRGKDKGWDYKKLAANFQDKTGTIHDVVEHVRQGHALCAGLLGGKWRAKKNVDGSWWILGDIDNSKVLLDEEGKPVKDENGHTVKVYDPQLTIEQALEHPFLKQYCSLIYTTASHTPDWHKFRVIFLLPQEVDADTVEFLVRGLMQLFPQLDPACKDASRVFYGATKATFPLIQPNAVLPQAWVDDAIATAKKEREEYQQRIAEIEERHRHLREMTEAEGWDIDALIQQALSYIPPRSPGSGNYQECLQVLMALDSHYGATEGEIIAQRWSPSIKGDTWNIRAKFKSFRGRSGVGIGTLFYIAKQYGFRFPRIEHTQQLNGLSRDSDRTISREQWENHPNRVAQHFADFKDLMQLTLTSVSNKARAFTGFGEPKQKKVLPALENGRDYQYPKDQRKETWQSAAEKWKFILDKSATGTGKSHTVGTLQAKDFDAEKIFYLAQDHRNPTTKLIQQNFEDIPTRHNGLAIDKTRKTPLGEPFRVTVNDSNRDLERTLSNCSRAFLFNLLAQKNIPDIQSSENPICGGCPMSGACAHSVGEGYGFKYLRMQALKAEELRAHPDSMPVPSDFDYENTELIWDETEAIFKPTKTISFNIHDIDSVTGTLYQENEDLLDKVKPLLKALRLIHQGEKPGRYGWDSSEIRAPFPEVPEDIADLITAVEEALNPDLSFLEEEPDQIVGAQLKGEIKKNINRYFRSEALAEDSKELKELPTHWLSDALAVLAGEGSIRYNRGQFHITRVNDRHRDIAKAAKANIFLSATMRREDLSLALGVDPDDILVIESERPVFENLKVTQIRGMGNLAKDRRPTSCTRVSAIKSALTEKHPGDSIAFLEWKTHADEGDGYHFRDGRGTNRFEKKSAIASVGIPFPDLGACKADYEALGGHPDGFQSYYNAKVQAEILQEVGRLRAQLRPDEQLHYYFIGNYDLTFLKEALPGATITTVDAFSITPEAGTDSQRTRLGIQKAFKQLTDAGMKTTQQAIAAIARISQGRVSQIAKEVGGWAILKKLLALLVKYPNGANNSAPPDVGEDILWWSQNYLPPILDDCTPVEVVAEVVYFVANYGIKAFEQALALVDEGIKIRLTAAIASHLIC